MIEINLRDVRREAMELVDEVGFDYRYVAEGSCKPEVCQKCLNWHTTVDGERVPGCIVGTILHRLGVELLDMPQGLDARKTVAELSQDGIVGECSEEVENYLRVMQVIQDAGGTWYSAYTAAEWLNNSGKL